MPKNNVDDQKALAGPAMPDLDFDDDTVSDGPGGGTATSKVASADDIETLKTQLAELTGKYKALQDDKLTLMATPVVKIAPQAPKAVSFEGLPDPVVDSTGYGSELARRLSAAEAEKTNYEAQVAAQNNSRTERLNSLWSDFTIEHADYAEDQTQVEFAAGKVLQKAQARGIDVDRYMFTHSDTFMSDVVAEMDKIFGKRAVGEEDDDTLTPKVAAKRLKGRTEGMIGGMEGGNKPSKAAPVGDDMFKEIKQFQMKHGYY